jgi:exosome complex component RRP42
MNYVKDLIKNKLRPDERNFLQYRDVKVSYNISKWAEGSAVVEIGKTKVVAGIKMDLGEPYPDTPEEGALITSAEFIPFASPDFEPGPPKEEAVELARVVDRGIRESKTIDMKKLCIEKGEKVWLVFIDIYVLNHDGNLIDAAALAALAALLKAKIPKLDKEGKVLREEHDKALPVKKKPVAITFYKINGEIILDTTKQEEDEAVARLTVTYDAKGKINAIQKALSSYWTIDEIKTCVKMGSKYAQKLRKELK